MADEPQHAPRPARPTIESLDARLAQLEQDHRVMVANQRTTDGTVAQLTTVLMPLVATVHAIESGQLAMRREIADFAGWSRDERAKDAVAAEALRDAEIARKAVEAAEGKLTAAKEVKRRHRQQWLRPLLQGLAGILLIVLTELVSSLHGTIGAYIETHTGWGAAGLLALAILVALLSLIFAVRAG